MGGQEIDRRLASSGHQRVIGVGGGGAARDAARGGAAAFASRLAARSGTSGRDGALLARAAIIRGAVPASALVELATPAPRGGGDPAPVVALGGRRAAGGTGRHLGVGDGKPPR